MSLLLFFFLSGKDKILALLRKAIQVRGCEINISYSYKTLAKRNIVSQVWKQNRRKAHNHGHYADSSVWLIVFLSATFAFVGRFASGESLNRSPLERAAPPSRVLIAKETLHLLAAEIFAV